MQSTADNPHVNPQIEGRPTAAAAPMRRRAVLTGAGIAGAVAIGAALSSQPAVAAPKKGAWPDWLDATRHGAAGDGETDEIPALRRILDEIGAESATVYLPRGRYALHGDLIFPPTVALVMDNGAVLEPAADVTVAISGPLSAGPYQVFGGDGTVVGRLGAGIALPQWWGAKADGKNDDTAAINAAIDAMYEAGGGTVHLSAGTYLLGTVAIGDPPRFSTLLIPRSGVNIEGEGDVTVLKAAAGLSEAGQWNFIIPPKRDPSHALNDVVYRNFKLDGNGENNLSDLDNPRWNNIGAEYGARITLDGLTFVNNASRQCIKFGFNQVQYGVTDLIIRNCRFDTLAAAVPGNESQNDHSAINVRVDRAAIDNNTFTQPYLDHASGATAIEVHSSNAIISNNQIINFHRGMIGAAVSHDHINVTYTNNVIVDCRIQAMRLHCRNDRVMDRVRISGNTIVQASPLAGEGTIDQQVIPMIRMDTVLQPITSLAIEDNVLSYAGGVDAPHVSNLGNAIQVGPCRNLKIARNQIRGTLGSAIAHLETVTDGEEWIEIVENQIDDCCRAPSGQDGSDTAILFGAAADPGLPALRLVRIERNSIINTGDQPTMERGIYGTFNLTNGTIADNVMAGTQTDLSWDAAATVTRLQMQHAGSGSPESVVRASVGSRYTNLDAGEVWDKVSGDTSAGGWVRREFAG